ncbi:adenosylcobinamide-GDP ribazoletransferase [Bradyrhizobium sp. KBS0727]|uniref:adenosylcobinamide-GDP ribazoletransferase n=1 Tax=unclassified Bradyrhizobium TaxID=2631580 RepID=UPI00110F30A2|nr:MULTISPECIES: adenosylcobinamide-GDP ribazoletransferase [unclassified Bradyrhizobium]QDW40938.1 adenosylcobinamide-GDP ribazoletransferase [Bradyrhizobium sp. KBS0725]QDW47544.1 adenosylcobinamide-GDP ribazoletransferase [Bradyrhizobium sp. KBS0727]
MNEWLDDFKMAMGFLTRLPVPHPDGAKPANFARAYRLFPVVGGLVGLAMGLLCLALRQVGVPDLAAAALVLGTGALLTGALHEDGLADVADGFGGGRDVEAKLAIMRDSRIGTYGAMALLVGFATKLSALAAIPDGYVVPSLISAHALARGVLPFLSLNLPYARQDGLARTSGQPDPTTTAIAGALALLIALLSLSWTEALWAAVAAAISGFVMARLALRQIGGQTGDILGAAEQVAETAILVLLAAKLASA